MKIDYKKLEFEKCKSGWVSSRIAGNKVKEIREVCHKGEAIIVVNAPLYRGTTERIIVEIENRFFVKMPDYYQHRKRVYSGHSYYWDTKYPKGSKVEKEDG